MDLVAEIAAERRELADLLDRLTPEQWATQSLCSAWTVNDVAAHLVMPLVTPLPVFGLAMLKARGNFDRASEASVRKVAVKYGGRLAATLRQRADHRFTPPGSDPRRR